MLLHNNNLDILRSQDPDRESFIQECPCQVQKKIVCEIFQSLMGLRMVIVHCCEQLEKSAKWFWEFYSLRGGPLSLKVDFKVVTKCENNCKGQKCSL